MLWEPIIKSSPMGGVAPNLRNYELARVTFSWEEARSEFDGLPDGGSLNIAHEAVDRHAAGPLHDKTAIRWLGKDGSVKDFSFARLRDLTNRFANALVRLGVGKGDRVYALMGRTPELYVTALGAFKNRSVFCPLFSAFGPEPIKARVNIGGAAAASHISSNIEPIASARIRCTTPNCTGTKMKSRSGRRDARSPISWRSCANLMS